MPTKDKVLSGLIWKFLERGGTQGIQFVLQIVLARLLLPEDYGVIALMVIFITLSNVFVQSSFNTALIQKKSICEEDYSSVFILSMTLALILYSILYLCAPYIASYYSKEIIEPVLRVYSLSLFLGPFSAIQNAVVARNMQFKRIFVSSVSGVITSGLLGILLAYMGYGVWALVAQQLTNRMVITLVLWKMVDWRPRLHFSIGSIKAIYAFGWKILVASFVATFYNSVYGLIIGRAYSSEMLGFYSRGDQFPKYIITNITSTFSSVMFPAMSAHQDNLETLKKMLRRTVSISAYVVFPAMIGLAACSESVIRLLLTEKWLPAAPFMQIMCMVLAFHPIYTANLEAFSAIGRSDIYLRLELIKKVIAFALLLASIPYGIYVMVFMQLVAMLMNVFIHAVPNKKLLGYTLGEFLSDVLPPIILSLLMGGGVYLINFTYMQHFLKLMTQITVGTLLYVLLSVVFKLSSFKYLYGTLKNFKKSSATLSE